MQLSGLSFRWKLLLSAAVLVALVVAGSAAWMLRDPVPYIMARRSSISTVTSELISVDSAHVNEKVVIEASSGLRVEMMLRRPVTDSSSPGSLRPAFVILGGYRTGDRAATLIPDTHGNIVVALAYPFDGDVGIKGLQVIPAVADIRRAILDTPAALMLAVDYLLSRPDVDSNRVELVGASFGAPFGCIAGALDDRVSRVWSVQGAAWPYRQIELNLRRNIPFGPARKLVAAVANVVASGPRLDPAVWAPRLTPRPFIMVNSTEDERMPYEAVMALFAAAAEPKEIIWLDGQHVHRSRPDVIATLVETVLGRSRGVLPQ